MRNIEVVRCGDRVFNVPRVCPVEKQEDRYEVSAEVVIVDGLPHFRKIVLSCAAPLSPLEVQRLGWGKLAESAIAEHVWELEPDTYSRSWRRPSGRTDRNGRQIYENSGPVVTTDIDRVVEVDPEDFRRALSKEKAKSAASRRRADERTGDFGRKEWKPVDRERMLRVVALRREADEHKLPYAPYVAEKMGYSPSYVRRLYMRAKKEGLTDGKH